MANEALNTQAQNKETTFTAQINEKLEDVIDSALSPIEHMMEYAHTHSLNVHTTKDIEILRVLITQARTKLEAFGQNLDRAGVKIEY